MSDKIEISNEMRKLFLNESLERFLKYVQIESTSDEDSTSIPSSPKQLEFGKMLVEELNEIGLERVEQDENGYVYAYLPASKNCEKVSPINLIAHMDTSPAASGTNVKPIIHKNYDGKAIKFPKAPELELSPDVSPYLKECIGMDIITSSGDTLLGADDKAGIAEIMTACVTFKKFPELKHGPIYICFTPDEEVGRGVEHINVDKIARIGYTIDGGEMGELNSKCFDAWIIDIEFIGINNHPGTAKNRMVNAIKAASYFMSCLPDAESPEHTELLEGFYHVAKLNGDVEKAKGSIIIRDFDVNKNEKRKEFLNMLKALVEHQFPGLKIHLKYTHSYKNMEEYLKKYPKIVEKAWKSIEDAGLKVINKAIRGGTDGAMLCVKGIPTPNIFTGGLLFHSRREYIPTKALEKAVEVIIRLVDYWRLDI